MVADPYNLSLAGNASGIVPLMQTVNDTLMNNMFGLMILVTVFIITLLSFLVSTNSFGKALTASSFIGFAISILLRVLDIIPDVVMYSMLALAAFSVAFFMGKD